MVCGVAHVLLARVASSFMFECTEALLSSFSDLLGRVAMALCARAGMLCGAPRMDGRCSMMRRLAWQFPAVLSWGGLGAYYVLCV